VSDKGPFIEWICNSGSPAPPPDDREEWEEIIKDAVPRPTRVKLVSREGGRWLVSSALENRARPVGDGPFDTTPIDHRDRVVAALKAKGKVLAD
jgi:hypothetical protein